MNVELLSVKWCFPKVLVVSNILMIKIVIVTLLSFPHKCREVVSFSTLSRFVFKRPTFQLFHEGGSSHLETRPLICRATQWPGFYMIGIYFMKEFILFRMGVWRWAKRPPYQFFPRNF